MIQEHELLTLLLGVGVLLLGIFKRRDLAALPGAGLIGAAYLCVLLGWVLTVLEGFCYPSAINLFEHACYLISSFLLALWCRAYLGADPGT